MFIVVEIVDYKFFVCECVWMELWKVVVVDSCFYFDFGEFIVDFEGGEEVVYCLIDYSFYCDVEFIFIILDNCFDCL